MLDKPAVTPFSKVYPVFPISEDTPDLMRQADERSLQVVQACDCGTRGRCQGSGRPDQAVDLVNPCQGAPAAGENASE